jgi:hypothetical protein
MRKMTNRSQFKGIQFKNQFLENTQIFCKIYNRLQNKPCFKGKKSLRA